MEYVSLDKYFHCFEVEDGIIGLAFPVDHPSGLEFQAAVKMFIAGGFDQRGVAPAPGAAAGGGSAGASVKFLDPAPAKEPKKEEKRGWFGRRKTKDGSDAPREMEIGAPTGFVHKTHIGWSPQGGFETRDIPPEWLALFKSAGVKKSDLKDAETAAFIMDTISTEVAKGGGVPPPPPARAAAPAPPAPAARPAPAPPAAAAAPPPPPPAVPGRPPTAARAPPPPPAAAPSGGLPPPPPPPGPPAAPAGGFAPPPPPPPSSSSSAGPPPPPPPSSGASAPPPPAPPSSANPLLAAIQKGATLRKVEEAPPPPPPIALSEAPNLADTLSKALAARRRAMPSVGNKADDSDSDDWSV